jgi:hypothetical protein
MPAMISGMDNLLGRVTGWFSTSDADIAFIREGSLLDRVRLDEECQSRPHGSFSTAIYRLGLSLLGN